MIYINSSLVLIFIILFVTYLIDKYKYNNGLCRKCNSKIELFSSDKPLGYVCPNCKKSFYINWDVELY